MGLLDDIGDLARQAASGSAQTSQPASNALSGQLADAFRSSQTPSFAEMASHLFANSNPDQKAGLLTRLAGSAGPSAISSILGPILGAGFSGASAPVTPEQANQVPPQAVKQLAEHAQNGNPSIVDEVAQFYSQHPQVVAELGGLLRRFA